MNTILQQRIEEAAHQYIQSDAVAPENMQLAFGDFINGAKFALQNQWISVEEALPEVDGHGYSKPVLVIDDTNEMLIATYSKIYNKWNSVGPVSYHRLVATHWMSTPSLKGGEK